MAEEDKITNKLRSFLGDYETELTLNVKKLVMNAKFIYSTLYLACEYKDSIEIGRFIMVLDILGETLHIKLTKEILKPLSKILGVFYTDGNEVGLQGFFKQLRFHMRRIYPDLLTPIINDETGNVELHENLLLNSQTFKNFIDEDEERELAHSNFTIRSIYSGKKSIRPVTGLTRQGGDGLDGIQEVHDDHMNEKGHEKSKSPSKQNQEKQKQNLDALFNSGLNDSKNVIKKDYESTFEKAEKDDNNTEKNKECNEQSLNIQVVGNGDSSLKPSDSENILINSHLIKSGSNIMGQLPDNKDNIDKNPDSQEINNNQQEHTEDSVIYY